ncbi:serine O-acetyltransferase [Cyclonatronum proteinivorum]|nr:serine acetyltransferase [Cyclonatronum proteinivorum]
MSSDAFLETLFREHQQAARCPSPALVADFFNRLLGFLFPDTSTKTYSDEDAFRAAYSKLETDFRYILSRRLNRIASEDDAILRHFFGSLPEIRDMLLEDIQAMYDGDPAAKSLTEVVRTYPGFYAIASHRIAHCLTEKGLHLIARIIASNAHSKTGIDIHPSARIGRHFCIDHGTGIVIGETTRIGEHVKIYQGVTLGALSVRKEDASKKRHPDIGNHVVIYAGATILGGQTAVGDHSVIGGNVWITESVAPHSKIYYRGHGEEVSG